MIIVRFSLSKLLTLDILLSAAARSLAVAKLVILGILFLTWFIWGLRLVVVAKLVISGILSSIFFALALNTSFLTA